MSPVPNRLQSDLRAAQIQFSLYGRPACSNSWAIHLAEKQLLAEILRSDDDVSPTRARRQRRRKAAKRPRARARAIASSSQTALRHGKGNPRPAR